MATNFQGAPDSFGIDDVRERIEELTAEFVDATESDPADAMSVDDWMFGLSPLDAQELADLIEFEDSVGTDVDYFYADSYMAEHAEELVNDCYTAGDLPSWVTDHIDWEAVADEIRPDYTDFRVCGNDYWGR